jgi:hypothetical protein
VALAVAQYEIPFTERSLALSHRSFSGRIVSGSMDGIVDGTGLGWREGDAEGALVGSLVGSCEGVPEGANEAVFVGP